jgi:hypothetical protein
MLLFGSMMRRVAVLTNSGEVGPIPARAPPPEVAAGVSLSLSLSPI